MSRNDDDREKSPNAGNRERRDSLYPEPDESLEVEDFLKTVHIRNLTRNVTEEHVREIFSEFGSIIHIDYPMESRNGRSRSTLRLHRGYTFIDYENKTMAAEAVEKMDRGYIDGNEIESHGFKII